MAKIKIRTIDTHSACAGLFMGGNARVRRKLEVGEVVDIPEDERVEGGAQLLQVLNDTGKVELTLDEPTRPFEFDNSREAKLTSPSFRPKDDDERAEVAAVWQVVRARMAGQAKPDRPERSPAPAADDSPPPVDPVAARARRRRRAQEQADGEKATT